MVTLTDLIVFSLFPIMFSKIFFLRAVKTWYCVVKSAGINPLPHIPILGSSNAAANKDMMSKILTNGDTIF